jgi:hypothetical protein
LAAQVAEFGREHDVGAPAFERLGEKLFIVAIIVIRGINEIDPDVNRAVQNGNSLCLVVIAQLALKSRTAKADGGNLEALLA